MELRLQLLSFLFSWGLGVLLGIIFDFYRLWSDYYRWPRWLKAFGDLFYWIIAAVLVFLGLMEVNGGQMRFYILLALILGLASYQVWFSRTVYRLLWRSWHLLVRLVRKITWLFTRPLVWLLMILAWPWSWLLILWKKLWIKLWIKPKTTLYQRLQKWWEEKKGERK